MPERRGRDSNTAVLLRNFDASDGPPTSIPTKRTSVWRVDHAYGGAGSKSGSAFSSLTSTLLSSGGPRPGEATALDRETVRKQRVRFAELARVRGIDGEGLIAGVATGWKR